MSDSELVYSTDPARNQKCPKCKKLIPECTCREEVLADGYDWTARIRLETANRQGKTVTVIDQLPPTAKFLEELARVLKSRSGAGGTFRTGNPYGIIEIQGDKREIIRKVLTQRGITFKG